MKTAFSPEQQLRIRRAKEILRHLCKSSGMSQKQLLQQLERQSLTVQQSAFANWLSPKFLNVRPKPEILAPLVSICRADRSLEQQQEILDEINLLLGYSQGPLSSEQIHNQVSEQLAEAPLQSLNPQQERLAHHLEALDGLLDLIEPRVMDYGLYHPVIRLEANETQLVRQLLGPEKSAYKDYLSEDGFEIPLTKIQSQEAIIRIIDEINEGTRLLQRYLDRHLNHPEGMARLDFIRVEDYISYAWEVSDRLLHHNQVIRALPALKRALLRQMTTCMGVKYILQNQSGESSEIAFQNLIALKSKDFAFDIHCSVAVYVGMLARQLLRSGSPERIERALKLYRRAAEWLVEHHHKLNTEQEIYHYKKELANLHYDIANFALLYQKLIPGFKAFFEAAMLAAAGLYRQVLDTDNLFEQGLTESRRLHLCVFSVLARCWSEPVPQAEKALDSLSAGHTLDESYWTVQIAHAIGYGALAERSRETSRADGYRQLGLQALDRARLLDGFAQRTEQEIETEAVLGRLIAKG